jgi:hypothetical protein
MHTTYLYCNNVQPFLRLTLTGTHGGRDLENDQYLRAPLALQSLS